MHLPFNQVKRKVRKATGMKLKRYIAFLRTEIACERLRSTNAPEETVATSSGFRTLSEMRRTFKRFYQVSPIDFRNSRQITRNRV